MTTKAKYTKFEWQIMLLLLPRTEPMTTRELQRALQLRSTLGVSRTLEQLERRGLITSSLVLDGLERGWRVNP